MERDGEYLKQAADRMMIQDLMGRYSWELDHGSADKWAALFTTNGVFEVKAMTFRIEGRPALASFARDLQQKMPGIHHVTTGFAVDIDRDRATSKSELNEFAVSTGGVQLIVQGYYEDDLMFDAGRWQISHRRVTTQFPDLATSVSI